MQNIKKARIRSVIIELFSERIFINESQAAKHLNISRYYIRKSLKEKVVVKNNLGENCAFFYNFKGINCKQVLKNYEVQEN